MKRNRSLAGLVWLTCTTWADATPREARMPGPAPIVRQLDAVAENGKCEGCHVAIAAEWRASLHHQAFTNAAFQRSLAREPSAFCRGCHAPEADPRRDDARLGELGIGCVTCHVLDRAPLAAPRDSARTAPHPVTRAAAFASPAACASCHEFDFPDSALRRAPLAMQRTLREHAASGAGDTPCATCHMPQVDGHRSHRFVASQDPSMLRSALRATASRSGARVIVRLEATDRVGHAMPTGDSFRRLRVVVEAEGHTRTTLLTRHFATRSLGFGAIVREETHDDRPQRGAPRTVEVDVARDATATWRVFYDRVSFPTDLERRLPEQIEGSVLLAEGTLPAP